MAVIDICNQAIGLLGEDEIASLTEESQAAKGCSIFYDPVRLAVLRSAPWAFANKRKTLALVGTNTVEDWGFTYEYPTDCLNPLRILTPSRNTDPPPFAIGVSDDRTRKYIYTDIEQTVLLYTADITSTEVFDENFRFALAHALAATIAMGLTGDQTLVDRMSKSAGAFVEDANTTSLNEKTDDPEKAADWTLAR